MSTILLDNYDHKLIWMIKQNKHGTKIKDVIAWWAERCRIDDAYAAQHLHAIADHLMRIVFDYGFVRPIDMFHDIIPRPNLFKEGPKYLWEWVLITDEQDQMRPYHRYIGYLLTQLRYTAVSDLPGFRQYVDNAKATIQLQAKSEISI